MQIEESSWICENCEQKLTEIVEFKREVNEKQKDHRPHFKIKEESEVAEIFLRQTSLDPFAAEEFVKEEFSEIKSEIVEEIESCKLDLKKDLKRVRNENSLDSDRNSRVICLDCGICLSPNDLIKHRAEAHLAEFICDICHKTCRSKLTLVSHIRRHVPKENYINCDRCSKDFERKKDLIAHNNRLHYETDNFVCEVCDEVHLNKKEMLKCRESHCGKKKSAIEVTISCHICDKTMKSSSIYNHIRLVHNKQRDQICQVCGKALKTSYDLKVHLRQHSGERPEVCETCGKTFVSYAQLYKHKKIRHMQRENFKCSICLKKLLSKFKLNCHMERFHPERHDNGFRVNPETNCYHCQTCSLKFVAMHKYENHLKLNDCHKYEGFDATKKGQKGDTKGEFKCQECGR